MNARSLSVYGLLAGLLLLSGCQRLNFEKEYEIEPFGTQAVNFDPPRYDQKVTVEVKSPGNPLSVYLVKGDSEKALNSQKNSSEVLDSKEKAEELTLNATVAAKTEYTVVLRNLNGKTVKAKVKVTGR
jgi:hypothetical protein